MSLFKLHSILGLVGSLLSAMACSQSTDFEIPPASAAQAYALSRDTLWLDTLPSLYLSSTYDLRLYNPSTSELALSHIRLRGGASRGFLLNVDGRSGDYHTGLRIAGRDSLFVFVRAHLPEGSTDAPETVTDSLEITDGDGRIHFLPVIAVRQNVTHIQSLVITSDTELTPSRPLLIRDSLVIQPGATLSLGAATQLWMGADSYIRVNGRLVTTGTAQAPVRIGAIRRDLLVPRVPYSRVPGQWGGIIFGDEGTASLTHLHLVNSKWGLHFPDVVPSSSTPTPRALLDHCYVSNISGVGLSAGRGHFIIRDSELSNTLGATLNLAGGTYEILRSTIVNLYAWPGIRWGAAIVYSNTPTNDVPSALSPSSLTLDHCVLDGSQAVYQYTQSGRTRERGGELALHLTAPVGTLVRITQTYARSIDYTDTLGVHFAVIRPVRGWTAAQTYRATGMDSLGRRDYRYDYHPLTEAPFVHQGNSGSGLTDLTGKPRAAAMTLGAYEYTAEP